MSSSHLPLGTEKKATSVPPKQTQVSYSAAMDVLKRKAKQQSEHHLLAIEQAKDTKTNFIRRVCQSVSTNVWFDRFIVCLILQNSVFLALVDPLCVGHNNELELSGHCPDSYCTRGVLAEYPCHVPFCDGWKAVYRDHQCGQSLLAALEYSEIVFTTCFSLEMVIKILAFSPLTYFRDPWNWIDSFVVLISWLGLIPELGNYSFVRVVRVLRPLRTITTIPGMKVLIKTLLDSIYLLNNVLMVFAFIFFLFGIIGVQLLEGRLRARCVFANGTQAEVERTTSFGQLICSTDPYTGRQCPPELGADVSCQVTGAGNPDFYQGVISFDNIFWSFLSIFQCITLEGWSDIMYTVSDGWDIWGSRIYFSLLVIIGGYFVVNLALAVLSENFRTSTAMEAIEMVQETEESNNEIATGLYSLQSNEMPDTDDQTQHKVGLWQKLRVTCKRIVERPWFSTAIVVCIILNTAAMAAEYHDQALFEKNYMELLDSGVGHVLTECPEEERRCGELVNVNGEPLLISAMDAWLQQFLDTTNLVLTIVFACEMALKLLGLGFVMYCQDGFNVFDGLIVISSVVELIVQAALGGGGSGGVISLFRAFRLVRVFKLARSWVALRKILESMQAALKSIVPLLLVMFMLVFVFSLLGMQLFGGQFGGEPRSHFDSFFPNQGPKGGYGAMVTVFQVLTGEAWNFVMYDAMVATHPVIGALYFVVLVVLGVFFVMNLFLAVLIEGLQGSFADEELVDQADDVPCEKVDLDLTLPVLDYAPYNLPWISIHGPHLALREGRWPPRSRGRMRIPTATQIKAMTRSGQFEYDYAPYNLDDVIVHKNSLLRTPWRPVSANPSPYGLAKVKEGEKPGETSAAIGTEARIVKDIHALESFDMDHVSSTSDATPRERSRSPGCLTPRSGREHNDTSVDGVSAEIRRPSVSQPATAAPEEPAEVFYYSPNSLFILPLNHPFRQALLWLVKRREFEVVILSCILVSSVLLAVENPQMDESSTFIQVTQYLDVFFIVVFSTEMILKVLAFGFVDSADSYCRDGWNILDGTIVIIAPISIALSTLKAFRSVRTLRALRPLRLINRNPGMKLAVNCLLQSIPSVANVILVGLLFFFVFAVLGIQFLQGKFFTCYTAVDLADPRLSHGYIPVEFTNSTFGEIRNWQDCERAGGAWRTMTHQRFDHAGAALLTLFEIATTEDWTLVMNHALDTGVQTGRVPVRMSSPGMAIYFVFFVIIGSFIILNLFVGVVTDNYYTLKEQAGADFMMTAQQKLWAQNVRRFLRKGLPAVKFEPKYKFQAVLYNLVSRPLFEWIVLGCILINMLLMACKHYKQEPIWDDVLFYSSVGFTIFFALEMVLKLVAYGPIGYFRVPWNQFDCVVVVLSLVGLLIIMFDVDVSPGVFTLLRSFRVARLFKLIKTSKSMQQLLSTLLFSLPSLGNVGGLLFLLLFIFSILGVQLFWNVKHFIFLNRHGNFEEFGSAFFLLLRLTSGEGWPGVLGDCMRGVCRACPENIDECWGCGGDIAVPFFLIFIILTLFILLNLFVAVILNNYAELLAYNTQADLDNPKALVKQFTAAWIKFDHRRTQMIKAKDLFALLQALEPPLGVGPNQPLEASNLVLRLNIAETDGRVHFGEVFRAIVSLRVNLPATADDMLKGKVQRVSTRALLKHDQDPDCDSDPLLAQFTLSEIAHIVRIQHWFRDRRARQGKRAKTTDSVEDMNRAQRTSVALSAFLPSAPATLSRPSSSTLDHLAIDAPASSLAPTTSPHRTTLLNHEDVEAPSPPPLPHFRNGSAVPLSAPAMLLMNDGDDDGTPVLPDSTMASDMSLVSAPAPFCLSDGERVISEWTHSNNDGLPSVLESRDDANKLHSDYGDNTSGSGGSDFSDDGDVIGVVKISGGVRRGHGGGYVLHHSGGVGSGAGHSGFGGGVLDGGVNQACGGGEGGNVGLIGSAEVGEEFAVEANDGSNGSLSMLDMTDDWSDLHSSRLKTPKAVSRSEISPRSYIATLDTSNFCPATSIASPASLAATVIADPDNVPLSPRSQARLLFAQSDMDTGLKGIAKDNFTWC